MVLADCRKCEYFVPASQLSEEQIIKAEKWLQWRQERGERVGHSVLGWCTAYGRPVTYYTGKCYRYKPRAITPSTKSILEYLGRG
ncbi:hypothetical protein [Pyrodictium abyssi]|uniref:Uncharacterized protein n=1 Tax=Pyrodictium abyssi TaxID=54256 RepID=A0ABM8IUN2_9CREN|nr:hypothetical protein PABY_08330 [Pyrodictium abyssi]